MGQDTDAVKECVARGRARGLLGPDAGQQADDEEHADREASAHVSRERHVPVRAFPWHLGKDEPARGERDEDHDGHDPVQGNKKRVVSSHEAGPSPVLRSKSETVAGFVQSAVVVLDWRPYRVYVLDFSATTATMRLQWRKGSGPKMGAAHRVTEPSSSY